MPEAPELNPDELSALRAYAAHAQAHPGAVAWIEGAGKARTRRALDQLAAKGHLERGLFGLMRISRKGRGALYRIDHPQT